MHAELAAQIQDEFELLLTKVPGKTPPEEIEALRKKIDEEQALLIQWAEEKVQLALTGHELLDAQMGHLESDLVAFKEELAEQGVEVDAGYAVDDYPMEMAAPETAARRSGAASRMQFGTYESLDPAPSLEPRTGGRKATQIPLSLSRQQSGYASEGYATGSDVLGWEGPKRGGGGGATAATNRRSGAAEGYGSGSRRRAASAAVHATAAAVAALDDEDMYGANASLPAADLGGLKYAHLEPFVPGLHSAAKEPQAPGRPLTEEDIGPGLVGCVAEVYWPDEVHPEDSLWYLVKIESVDMQTMTASIRYQNGEMEPTLSLMEVARDQHMMLINMGT